MSAAPSVMEGPAARLAARAVLALLGCYAFAALAIGLASAALLATGMWPVLREAMASGAGIDSVLNLSTTTLTDWLSFRTPLSLAAVGAIGIVGAYLFIAYRLILGARRLAAGRAAD
jgi:nitrate reductase NapE component